MSLPPLVESTRIEYSQRECKQRNIPIFNPEDLIRNTIDEFGSNLAVSCSFGSCSVVVLHMALKNYPKIKVVFNDTGVGYPQTYRYMKRLTKDWDLNLIVTKPVKSFWRCVEEYGFPLIRSSKNFKKYGKYSHSYKPPCCVYTKELPFKKICKKEGIIASITGLRAAESRVRMFTLGQRGQKYLTKKWGKLWKIHPIAFWTEKQVFAYLENNDIPINELYKIKKRTGCMPCTGYKNWEKMLSKTNLKMYRYIQSLRHVNLMDNYLDFENPNGCNHPTLDE